MAAHSYSADFLVWWKDFWVSTHGMNPSPESKAAAWGGWQAGRNREAEVWNTRPTGPNSELIEALDSLQACADSVLDVHGGSFKNSLKWDLERAISKAQDLLKRTTATPRPT